MSEKLSEEEIEKYREAGEIVSDMLEMAEEMIEPCVELIDIAEKVENKIYERGAKPAFPCNISINEKAAHYSPPVDDETEIEEDDLVKVDVGAHVDGYIGDSAITVKAGSEEEDEESSEEKDSEETEGEKENEKDQEDSQEEQVDMVEAVNQVLETAIDCVEPGVNIGEIGRVIEEKADEFGYSTIENLTGHNLERYSLHGGVSIPNVEKEKDYDLEEGDVIALEPFVTDGEGEVEDSPEVYIFRYLGSKDVSGRMARQTLGKIRDKYGDLPFSERWLAEDLSRIRLQMTLRELLTSKALHPYYVLKEVEDGMVAQAEHSLIVTEDGCEVFTR